MATISNSARISGLASGLDVESIIDGLTQGTQLKIEKAKQDLQVLEWKKESYQGITDALYSFQNTYCGSSNFSMLYVDDLKRLSASSSSNYVTVTATDSAVAESVYVHDIVSLASAARVSSSAQVSANPTLTANTELLTDLSGKSFSVTLDGISKTLTFSDKTYTTVDDAATELQSLLSGAFGAGRISVSSSGETLSLDAGNSILILNDSGAEGGEVSDILAFTSGISNRISLTASIADSGLAVAPGDTLSFTINGSEFSFTSENSIKTIMETINDSDAGVTMSYSRTTDTFTIVSSETGSASSVDLTDVEGSFLSSIIGTGIRTDGTDAVLRVGINGDTAEDSLITLTRSTNTFDVDGTTFTLNGMASGGAAEEINVTVSLDAQTAAEKITEFVGAYNSLLKTITDKLYETVYSGYDPLTEDQKKDMTDSEIEDWTAKAKSGLLNNDSVLSSIYTQLRTALFDPITGEDGNSLGINLASIGISTQSYSTKGQLTIDQDKLLSALKSDPDAVLSLFTQSSDVIYSHFLSSDRASQRYTESGVLWRINDIIKNNLSTVGNTGALVTLIGSPEKEYKGQTTYSKKINTAQDKIDTLLDKLDKEEDSYWKKYTALETAMSQLNSMSGYLSSLLPS